MARHAMFGRSRTALLFKFCSALGRRCSDDAPHRSALPRAVVLLCLSFRALGAGGPCGDGGLVWAIQPQNILIWIVGSTPAHPRICYTRFPPFSALTVITTALVFTGPLSCANIVLLVCPVRIDRSAQSNLISSQIRRRPLSITMTTQGEQRFISFGSRLALISKRPALGGGAHSQPFVPPRARV